MKLTINGESKTIKTLNESSNLNLVIEELGLNAKLIVIELNGLILNPKKWSTQIVKNGDIIEIVTIVGGG